MALNISWNAPTIKEIRVPDNTFGDKLSKGLSYIDSGLQRRRANRIEDERLKQEAAERFNAKQRLLKKENAYSDIADMLRGGDIDAEIEAIEKEIKMLEAENQGFSTTNTNTMGLEVPLSFTTG